MNKIPKACKEKRCIKLNCKWCRPKKTYTNILLELKKELKTTLENNPCRWQCLDNQYDRRRVKDEIFKMLITKYEFKKL